MDGIAELAGPDSAHESGRYRYELTGVAGPAQGIRTGNEEHAGSEFVIAAGDLGIVARTAGPVSEVAEGSRVTAQCTLVGWPGKVLRSFEIERMSRWDDDHPGTIMAWYVLDLTPLPASQDPAGLQPTIS